MSYEEGDWTVPSLTVAPYDGSTAVTLTIVAPNGTTTTPAVNNAGGGVWNVPGGYEFTTGGEWIERWAVIGTGKSKERRVNLVAPDPAPATAARVYATSADYANELHAAPPTGIRRMLITASRAVDEMLLTAVYDTDVDGYPTEAATIQAFKTATCLQAEFASTGGDRNLVGATKPSSFSIGKLSVTKAATSTGLGGLGRRGEWSPRAWAVLQAAGLTGHEPWS